MSLRGLFAISKSNSFLARTSIFNNTVHNINNARVDIINNNRRMSMDMGGHGSMDNNISSSFTEDKVGMVEEEKEKGGSITSISGSKRKSDQVGSVDRCLHHHCIIVSIITTTISIIAYPSYSSPLSPPSSCPPLTPLFHTFFATAQNLKRFGHSGGDSGWRCWLTANKQIQQTNQFKQQTHKFNKLTNSNKQIQKTNQFKQQI